MGVTRRALAATLLLAAGGCVTGAGAGRATGDGRVSAQAPGPAWKRIAVLPFAGPPQYRRVCEEALAVRLGEQATYAIVPPYSVRQAAARAGAEDAAAPGWAALVLAPPPRPRTRAELQELARGLGVDALVAGALVRSDTAAAELPAGGEDTGRIPPLGPLGLDVVVVDGASGEVVVRERWRESSGWAGIQRDATLHATACAGADLLAILGTPPGEPPRRPRPDPDCGAPVSPSPGP